MLNRGATALAKRTRGQTQETIAEKLGCSQGYVSRLLKGKVPQAAGVRTAAKREYRIGWDWWDEPAAPAPPPTETEAS